MTLQESVWSETESPRIKTYTLINFHDLPQIQKLSEQQQFEMEVVGNVLPFKANNYVVEQLIDWNNTNVCVNFPTKRNVTTKTF